MGIICSKCSFRNPKQSAFCASCGNKLFLSGHTGQFIHASNNRTVFNTSSANILLPVSARPQSITSTATPITPFPPSSVPLTPIPFSSIKVDTHLPSAILRSVLTGRGRLITHYSWLLEGKYIQATPVRTTIMNMFRQHGVPGLKADAEKLIERSLTIEEREYVIVQRGIFTVFIYITPTGRDLYISRATVVLSAISSVRVTIFSILLFLLAVGFIALGSIRASAHAVQLHASSTLPTILASSLATEFFISLFTCLLLLFFIAVFIRSCITWFTEKDFWLLLRSNSLNTFQMDDVALLEHTSDSIIRDAVKYLGLDATKLTPPPLGYQPMRKIRRI